MSAIEEMGPVGQREKRGKDARLGWGFTGRAASWAARGEPMGCGAGFQGGFSPFSFFYFLLQIFSEMNF